MIDDRLLHPARLEAVVRSGLLDTSPETPFDRLTALARELTGAPMAFVTVVDSRRSFWKSCVGVVLPAGAAPQNPVEESFCQYVVASGEPLVLPDVREDERTKDNPSIASMGVIAWAGYPVFTPDGEVLGTFCVVDTEPHHWTARDERVLETLAQAASSEIGLRMQLDVARRQADEAVRLSSLAQGRAAEADHVALVLQRSLLSPPPALAGLELEVRYQPAAAHAQVGGDWYDAFEQPDGSAVVVVGDVVGHDIQAAAAMGQVRGLVRSLSFGSSDTPAQLLSAVDQAMRGLHVDAMATVVVAHVQAGDVECTRRVRWSSAGHMPPLLTTADGQARVLSTTPDLLLGVRPGGERLDHEVVLDPGSTLLLVTDGLVERRDQSIKDRMDELRDLLAGLCDAPLGLLCDTLLEKCLLPVVEDDVALLALRPRVGART